MRWQRRIRRQNWGIQRRSDEAGKIPLPVALAIPVLLIATYLWASNYPTVGRNTAWGQETTPLMSVALGIGGAVFLCCVSWNRFVSRQRWSLSEAIMHLLVMVFFSWIILTQVGIALNGALDRSATQTFQTQVLDKSVTHYKSQTNCILTLRDWRNPYSAVKVQVPEARFNQVKVGQQIEVETKPGALGVEWMMRHS
jgi:hypothetical protein